MTKFRLHGEISSSKYALHGHISTLEIWSIGQISRLTKLPLLEATSSNRERLYVLRDPKFVIRILGRNLSLHGQISSIQINFEFRWIRKIRIYLECTSTQGEFEEKVASATTPPACDEICPTRANFIVLNFRIILKFRTEFWNSEFWNISELEQNWCNNGAQFHQLSQLSGFSKFKFEHFVQKFEIERLKGELTPSILKFFDPTTCSFTVKSLNFDFKLKSNRFQLKSKLWFHSRKLHVARLNPIVPTVADVAPPRVVLTAISLEIAVGHFWLFWPNF